MKVTRAALTVALALGLLVAPLVTGAQQTPKPVKIGFLLGGQMSKFELVINLKTAKSLGLRI